ncbi:peptide-binding protein [Thioalkalivibrio thiocyanodenitrificans]|uniref:peptide-binding protein n=1 Tax=Thioalkalivibrio thiocyanodenitrificans TaxID=243063 RepID=UPI000380A505|nr:peptide-binding protein [Thioalkalivibrio thiocyanodenitrificans]
MEKRFSARDLPLIIGLSLIVILMVLLMYQVDRQWSRMAEMHRAMQEQSDDLRRLRVALQSLEGLARTGALAPSDAPGAADDVAGAFQRALRASRDPEFAPGDWLVRAFPTGLSTVTPLVSSDAYASEVQGYVLESLLTRDPDTLEWQGLIARDWDISEDGLIITFRMRPDVTFSDGTPLTADDVMFTFDFIMTEAIAAPRSRAFMEKLERVEALDEHEVAFTFAEPYFNSLQLAGGMAILPRHFYESYLDEPETFNQSRGLLMGSGPYRLSDPKGWTPDQGLVELERNPRYWGPVEPPFDRVVWRVIENDSARLTTFRNGDIDAYGARPREYQRLLDDEQLRERTRHYEYMSPTAGYVYIGWNQERDGKATRFADRRVRQAMSHLTHIDRIIDEIMLGYAEPAVSPFNPRSPQHDTSLEPYPFDLARAGELLHEAGYRTRNRDGILQDGDGRPFEFDLVFFQDNEDTRRIVLFLRDLYARAGILMRPRPTEWSVMLDLLNRKDFDAITLGWTSGVETDIYQMFHSSQTVGGGDNFINYRNPALDELIDRARSEVNEDARMPLWQEAERILHEDQPYTFLMRRQTLAFIDRRVKNLGITRLGLNMGIVPVEIYVPVEQQRYAR